MNAITSRFDMRTDLASKMAVSAMYHGLQATAQVGCWVDWFNRVDGPGVSYRATVSGSLTSLRWNARCEDLGFTATVAGLMLEHGASLDELERLHGARKGLLKGSQTLSTWAQHRDNSDFVYGWGIHGQLPFERAVEHVPASDSTHALVALARRWRTRSVRALRRCIGAGGRTEIAIDLNGNARLAWDSAWAVFGPAKTPPALDHLLERYLDCMTVHLCDGGGVECISATLRGLSLVQMMGAMAAADVPEEHEDLLQAFGNAQGRDRPRALELRVCRKGHDALLVY